MKNIPATVLFNAIGLPSTSSKSGPAIVLRELNKLGIKPVETVLVGKGVQFLVSKSDFDSVIENRKSRSVETTNDPQEEGISAYKTRKNIRSIARALLDLYERLGEAPHAANAIVAIAERDLK